VANFQFTSFASGPGADVDIDVQSGLTKKLAAFKDVGFEYHIHVNPVADSKDCMTTGGHLDPMGVGAAKCDRKTPENCQEGDLSGKRSCF